MTLKRRVVLARWLLVFALLGCAYCAVRGAMLVYFMRPTADVSLFRPATAEDVGRIAQPFQTNTREADGLFRIVQKQHVELDMMFSRLETAAELSWSLAVIGTVILMVLSCAFAASLALLLGIERRLPDASKDTSSLGAASI
jgi:hypothetical protein